MWQSLTWLRSLGGSLFLFGGVLPLVWFVLSRGRNLVPEADILEGEWIAYDKEWARDEDEIVRAVEGDSPSE